MLMILLKTILFLPLAVVMVTLGYFLLVLALPLSLFVLVTEQERKKRVTF